MQSELEQFQCMTTTIKGSERIDVVGMYSLSALASLDNMHSPQGQLCGKCREGFAPPVYSYSLSCVNYSLNWLKYLSVAFGPLTLVFHISPTSVYLHGFIFYAHITYLPTVNRLSVLSLASQIDYSITHLIPKQGQTLGRSAFIHPFRVFITYELHHVIMQPRFQVIVLRSQTRTGAGLRTCALTRFPYTTHKGSSGSSLFRLRLHDHPEMNQLDKTQGNVLLWLLIVQLFVRSVDPLERFWTESLVGKNCSSFLHIPIHSSSSETDVRKFDNCSNDCPPWYQPSGNGTCQFGNNLGFIVKSAANLMQSELEQFYCMTTANTSGHRMDVVGSCLYSFSAYLERMHYPLPCNISQLNDFMCGDLNREGQLCGKCREGFAPPVYSYSLSCVNCTDYSLNWLKYLAVAFGPLTLFSIFVSVFHISPTSVYLHGFIFYAHITCLPTVNRLIVLSKSYNVNTAAKVGFQTYFSMLGIWSLDFFRLVYEPFCLHPNMTIVQALALDYIIAAYPLLLVSFTYLLVYLYAHDCRLVVTIWKLLRRTLRPVLRTFDIRTSLIDSFATLFLLSTVKFQSVTFDLLIPTTLHHVDGTSKDTAYLYLAGNVRYLGPDHLPYAILAFTFFITLIILPLVLFCLYPCDCFQKCLNKCHCNSYALRTFMDVFLGKYKDKTNHSKDLRYFAAVFLTVRPIIVALVVLLDSYYAVLLAGIIVMLLGFSVAIIHPQVSQAQYYVDTLFLVMLAMLCFAGHSSSRFDSGIFPAKLSQAASISALSLPILFMFILILYYVVKKRKVPQKVIQKIYALVMRNEAAVNEHHHILIP